MKTQHQKNQNPSGGSEKITPANGEDTLRHLAFDNSSQANIVSMITGEKILLANNSACKLLGYSKKELLTKSREDIVDIYDIRFKKMLEQRKVRGKASALVTVIKKCGKRIPCEITSAIFVGETGIEMAIITITNMSQNLRKQKSIDTKKEKIVADNIVLAKSKQKGIDTKKEKIVADNIVIAKSKQKSIDTKKEKIVADNIVIAKSKQKSIDIKKEKIVADNIILAKSKQKSIDAEKGKTVADNIILARAKSDLEKMDHEVAVRKQFTTEYNSKQTLLEEKLKLEFVNKTKDLQNFRQLFNISPDVLFDIDAETNEVIFSAAYEKLFGYKMTGKMTIQKDWAIHIHPDDKERINQAYLDRVTSEDSEWKYNYRFLRADGSVANILSTGIILRNEAGKVLRMIGVMHDISKESLLEEKLEEEIRIKEKQIEEAMEEAKETERSDLGKELHDNVNQLLAASRMYIALAKRGEANSETYLNRSSEYTLAAIEEIRKLAHGLTTDTIISLGLREAIEDIIRDTMEGARVKISFMPDGFIENSVNNKFKLNMFRIVQEQLNNILKHARATKVYIRLLQNKKTIRLTLTDNGVGFDTDKTQKGIGVANIKSRAASYNGTADFISLPGRGCVLTVTFPPADLLPEK